MAPVEMTVELAWPHEDLDMPRGPIGHTDKPKVFGTKQSIHLQGAGDEEGEKGGGEKGYHPSSTSSVCFQTFSMTRFARFSP